MTFLSSTPPIQRKAFNVGDENASPYGTPGKSGKPSPARGALGNITNSAQNTPSRLEWNGEKPGFNSPNASCFMEAVKPIPAPPSRVKKSELLTPPKLVRDDSLILSPFSPTDILSSSDASEQSFYNQTKLSDVSAAIEFGYNPVSDPNFTIGQPFDLPQSSTSPYALNLSPNVVIAEIPEQISRISDVVVSPLTDRSQLNSATPVRSESSSSLLEMDSLSISPSVSLEADTSLEAKPIPLASSRSRLGSTASSISSVSSVSSHSSRKSRLLETLATARSTSADLPAENTSKAILPKRSDSFSAAKEALININEKSDSRPRLNSYDQMERFPIEVSEESLALEYDEFSINTAPVAVKPEPMEKKQVHINEVANESFAISARADTSIDAASIKELENSRVKTSVSEKPSKLVRAWSWLRGLFSRQPAQPVTVAKTESSTTELAYALGDRKALVQEVAQSKATQPSASEAKKLVAEQRKAQKAQIASWPKPVIGRDRVATSWVKYSGTFDRELGEEIEENVLLEVGTFSSDKFSPLGLGVSNRSRASTSEMGAWRKACGLDFSLLDPNDSMTDTYVTHRMGWIDTDGQQGRVKGKSGVLFFFERPYGSDEDCKGTVFLQASANIHPSQFSEIAREYLLNQRVNVAFIYCPEQVSDQVYLGIIEKSEQAVLPLLRDKPMFVIDINKPLTTSQTSVI